MADNVNKVKTFDEEIHDIEDTQARTDIANRYTKAEVDTLLSGKVNNDEVYDKSTLNSILDSKADETSVYTKAEADVLLNSKANVSNVYTRTEADSIFNTKANASDVYTKTQADDLLSAKANASDVYTKTEADTLLGAKADSSDVYTKTEADTLLGAKADSSDVYTKTETDNLLGDKANSSDVYTKTEADTLLGAKADSSNVYTKTEADNLLGDKANSSDVYTKTEADTLLGAKANSADVYTITQTDGLLANKAEIDDSETTSLTDTWSTNKLNTEFENCAKLDSANTFEGGNTLKDHFTTIKMSNLDITDDTISPSDGNAGIPIVDKNGVPLAYINIWQRTENGVTRCDLAIGTEIGTTNPNGLVLINGAPAACHVFAENLTAGGTIGDKLQEIATALQPHQNYLGRIILEINGVALRWSGGADWSTGAKLNGSTEYIWYLVNFTAGNLQMRQVYTNSGSMGGESLNNLPFNRWRIYSI